MPKGQYARLVLRANAMRVIGRAELAAARKQAAERAGKCRLQRNVAIAVGLVVLYMVVTWLVAHVGGR